MELINHEPAIEFNYLRTGVEVAVRGRITDRQLVEANRKIYHHDYPDGFSYQLFDMTEAVVDNFSSDTMLELAEMDRRALSGGQPHYAAVACSRTLYFALSRMWEVLAESPNLQTIITRTRLDAIAWLKDKGWDELG